MLPIGYSVLLPWIQTSLSLKPEIVFNQNKIIIWAYSSAKKGNEFLLLLKAFSWETNARWFYSKKRKIGKGNLYLTEHRLSWNEMCCASDNHNYMCHTCVNDFFRFELELSSYWQNINFFTKLPQIPHIHINCNFQLFRPAVSSL